MKSARIRALRRSILELIEDAMPECSGIGIDCLFEARALVEILCEEFDDGDPEELDFD